MSNVVIVGGGAAGMAAAIAAAGIGHEVHLYEKNEKDVYKRQVPYGTREVFGLAEGAVGIAENEFYEKLLSADDRAAVEELKGKVMAGEVEMTPTIGITTEKINEIREAARP